MTKNKTVLLALAAAGALGFPGVGCARDKAPAVTGAPQAPEARAEKPAATPEKEPFGRFSVDELAAKLQTAGPGKPFLYDNNSPERYKKSHLPGAKWLNYEAITERDLPKDKDATLVFYCANEH